MTTTETATTDYPPAPYCPATCVVDHTGDDGQETPGWFHRTAPATIYAAQYFGDYADTPVNVTAVEFQGGREPLGPIAGRERYVELEIGGRLVHLGQPEVDQLIAALQFQSASNRTSR